MEAKPLPFSSDIAAAMLVVEKMVEKGHAVLMERNGITGQPLDDWDVCFPKGEHPDLNMASASTLPLAICKAAVKVIKGE